MNRRSILVSLAASLFPAPQTQAQPQAVTPAQAGFGGWFRMYGGHMRSGLKIILRRCRPDNPMRHHPGPNQLVVWKGDADVERLVWCDAESRLFELRFYPMERE